MNDRWERLIDLYHAAVMLPADERATLLAEECGDDSALRADVERMIVAHHRVSRPTGAAAAVDSSPPHSQLDSEGIATAVDSAGHEPAPEKSVAPAASGVVTAPIDGEPIDAYAENRRFSLAERLELFVQLCGLVASAHRRGVTHGTLSPESILVNAAGVPKLPDVSLGDDTATVATDINALGAVLDRLLGGGVTSGRRPLRRELDTIILKALRTEGRWRYESVEALAADVRNYLDTPRPARERRAAGATQGSRPRSRRAGAVLAWTLAAVAVAALGIKVLPLLSPPAQSAPVTAPVAETPPLRTRLAVGDLADQAADPQLAAALSDALRTGLMESPSIVVASTRTQAEVSGSVLHTAGVGYTLTLQLTDTRSANDPLTLEETAPDSTALMSALNRLSERLRERLGESHTSISATPRLDEVTTASLPALRAFANGSRAIRSGDRTVGIRLLRAAVAADTGFAAAHRALGLTYRDAGDRTRAQDALDHAAANHNRLPFYERNQTIASQAMTTGGYAVAIDAYNRILTHDPADVRVLNRLGSVYAARREFAVQESLMVRAIRVDPSVPSLYTALALATVNQAKYGASRRILDSTERRFPGLRATQLVRVSLAASQQNWEAAEREARELVARAPADSGEALDASLALASIVMAQGRLGEAEQELRRVIALGGRRRAVRQSFAALSLAYLELRYRHSPAAAVAAMNATLARFPLARMEPGDRPYDDVARLFADAGQPTRAAELMAQAARANGQRGADATRRWTAGAIAMAERRAWEGEIEILGAAETHPCPICALPDLARAYEVAGKSDAAIATYERYVQMPWQQRFETDAFELGFAMKRLGELYQQQNDRTKAAAQYSAVLQLWRRADGELGPLVADVRRRLDETTAAR